MKKQPARQPSRATSPVLDRAELATVRGGTAALEDLIKSTSYEDNWRIQR